MSRVNAYLAAGNDEGKSASIGGRGRSDSVWARLNTDNGGGSDCGLYVKAEVCGERQWNGAPRKLCDCGHRWAEYDTATHCPKCGEMRQGTDTRKSFFTVELPEQSDGEYCEVRIREHNAGLADLARFGGMLATIKAASDVMSGDEDREKRGVEAIQAIKEIMAGIDDKGEYGNVILPTGVTLQHALACVEIVGNIIDADKTDEN